MQLEAVGDVGRPALVQRRQLLGHLRRADSLSGSVAAHTGCIKIFGTLLPSIRAVGERTKHRFI